ncbi:Hypothetical predicted protein [Cloeon dipterum]|uniref:DUF3421 domain-containing protein n=1 Tax=Cloeon dipterum TaxID=197152 RepID=A0A8S1E268_9INSE|nr:Hypothetical predicted protein [Cloeon dipterum]
MSGKLYWQLYDLCESEVPVDELVSCSPNNVIPSYVVGELSEYGSGYLQPGYASCYAGSFGCGYVVDGTKKPAVLINNYYFLLGGNNVSFRPHQQVPEYLKIKAGFTVQGRPYYIGTINIAGEELSGPVIDGVCYVYRHSMIFSDGVNYKVLAYKKE